MNQKSHAEKAMYRARAIAHMKVYPDNTYEDLHNRFVLGGWLSASEICEMINKGLIVCRKVETPKQGPIAPTLRPHTIAIRAARTDCAKAALKKYRSKYKPKPEPIAPVLRVGPYPDWRCKMLADADNLAHWGLV